MENVAILLLFLICCLSVPSSMAMLFGLKFQIQDYGCKQEVDEVKNNILMLKIALTSIAVMGVTALILLTV